MAGDEFAVLILGSILTAVFAARWYIPPFRLHSLQTRRFPLDTLLVIPPLCGGLLVFILLKFSDPQVSGDPMYVLLFTAVGGAWLLVTTGFLSWLGFSFRDDVLERHNRPAAVVLGAALVASTIIFAGANIGDGPTIWTTIGPAILGTAILFAIWLIHAKLTDLSESIAIDRDPAAACRAGGFYIATAIVLGRAVAGDWISSDATIGDFIKQGWPASVLLGLAIVAEKIVFDQMDRPRRRALRPSIAAAGIFILLAVVAVLFVDGPIRVNKTSNPRHVRAPVAATDEP